MKELGNKLISNLHYIILFYGLYGVWIQFNEHTVQLEQIQAQSVAIDQEIATNQRKLKEIEEFSKKTDEYRVRVETVAKNIEEVQKQLPAETNDSQILSFLSQEMSVLNIKDPNLVPGTEGTSAYYISKDYNLKAKGTYLQFLILFERIGNAARIYNVKSLKLNAADDGKKGRFQMVNADLTIQAFRYNPDFKVDRGFDKAPATTGVAE